MAENQSLPSQFAGLTKWLSFALPTPKERLRKRVHSEMSELNAFYDAMRPQMDAVMTYLMDFPADESQLEAPVLNLVRLAKAYMEVSLAVELFKAPDEPGVWDFEFMELEAF
jgi:hypothetical protein